MKLTRNRKIVIAIALAVNALVLLNIGVVYGLPRYTPEIAEPADAVVVLGAAIYTPALYNRTVRGLEVYEAGLADAMVLAGGKVAPSDLSEAEYMEQVVLSRAEADPVYYLEDLSKNTYENINNTKRILERELDKPVGQMSLVIVSDEYHLGRAFAVAKRAGFETVYWRSPTAKAYETQELKFYYFREFLAMFRYIPRFIVG